MGGGGTEGWNEIRREGVRRRKRERERERDHDARMHFQDRLLISC